MGLSMYGDPDKLDRLAGRLRARAAEVRQHADDHVRRGQAARWVSTAAQAYRDRVVHDRAQAYRAADELEQAAHALQVHAQHVRETIALIARYEREATAWFEHQAHRLAHMAEGLVDSAGRAVKSLVPEAPWSTWPIGPHNLPASGSKDWLEVGAFMQKHGAL